MILALILVITGSIVSVSAEDFENDTSWIDLYDYAAAETSRNFSASSALAMMIYYNLPGRMRLYSFDFLVFITSSYIPELCIRTPSGTDVLMNRVQVSNKIYRYYVDAYSANYDEVDLVIRGSSGYAGSIISAKVSTSTKEYVSDIGTLSIDYVENDYTSTMSSAGSSVSYYTTVTQDTPYTLDLYSTNWKKYDYLEFVIETDGMSIDSIAGFHGNIGLDVQYNYFNSLYDGHTYLALRMDLTGLDRDSSIIPRIVVSGVVWDFFSVCLFGVTGYYDVDPPDPYIYWLGSIHAVLKYRLVEINNTISSGFGSVNGWLVGHFTNLKTWLSDGFTNVVNSVNTGFSNLSTSLNTHFNNLKDWLSTGFKSVTDKLDILINGTEDQQQSANDMENNFGSFNDSAGGYEEDAISGIQNNFGEVTAGFDFVNIATPMAFVATYLNGAFSSLGQYSIVIMLPLYIAAFLFILSRVPGGTKPVKHGDKELTPAEQESLAKFARKNADDGVEFSSISDVSNS